MVLPCLAVLDLLTGNAVALTLIKGFDCSAGVLVPLSNEIGRDSMRHNPVIAFKSQSTPPWGAVRCVLAVREVL